LPTAPTIIKVDEKAKEELARHFKEPIKEPTPSEKRRREKFEVDKRRFELM